MTFQSLSDALSHEFLDSIIEFWFRHLKNEDHIIALDVDDAITWFSKDEAYDQECTAKFGAQLNLIQAAQASGADILHAAKPSKPLHWIAIILLLDQLPRNCFRGSEAWIAYNIFDKISLDVALQAIKCGIPRDPRVRFFLAYSFWFYMPLEHSEVMEIQDMLTTEHDKMFEDFELLMGRNIDGWNGKFAHCREVLLRRRESYESFKDTIRGICDDHKEQVRRFGRFPHRNDVLGRTSTDEEARFLRGAK